MPTIGHMAAAARPGAIGAPLYNAIVQGVPKYIPSYWESFVGRKGLSRAPVSFSRDGRHMRRERVKGCKRSDREAP